MEDEFCSDREYQKGTRKKRGGRNKSLIQKLWISGTWNPNPNMERPGGRRERRVQRFRVTSLAYCPNRMESKKLKREVNK